MSPTELRTRLEDARDAGVLARIGRSLDETWEDGYVLGLGPDLVLVAVVGHGIRYDGYQVYRLGDITRLDVPAPHARFVESALSCRGQSRPGLPSVSLDDIPALLRSVSATFPLMTIYTEDEDPEVCWIGQLLETDEARTVFRHISPDASWDEKPETYPVDEITRVDFGGAYEEALWLVASSSSGPDVPSA